MGSLPEERSKAISVSSHTTYFGGQIATHHGQTASHVHRWSDHLLGRSDHQRLEQSSRPCFRYTRTCSCNGGETFGVNRDNVRMGSISAGGNSISLDSRVTGSRLRRCGREPEEGDDLPDKLES
jgi:hypothetical protein